MSVSDVALLGALVFAFSVVSKRLEKTILTAPLVFVLVGLLVGETGFSLFDLDFSEGALHVLAELTLVMVLFGDATRIDVRTLRREWGLPIRLLGVGLPLSMALGAVLGKVLLPALSWFEAAALGAVLAPTDAALGQAVVSSPVVPVRIRQALNVESGLNDGIALPFVLVFASLASMGHGDAKSASDWVQFAALQVTLGPIAGGLIAWGGGALVHKAADSGYVADSAERLSGLALSVLCFAGAELIGGNGLIGAFVGGLTFGHTQRGRCHHMVAFLEAEGELFMLLVFLGMGATLVSPAFAFVSLPAAIYVALSLTCVRMVPVSLSLWGSGLRAPSHLFLGWFGPRGLASILYGILLLAKAELPHEQLVFSVIIVTATASVFLHGMTAVPGAKAYGVRARDAVRCPAENSEVIEHATRGSM